MKKKTRVLLASYTAALIAVLGVCLFRAERKLYAFQSAEQHARLAAVSQLSDSLTRMSDTMAKGKYVSSPELLASLSAEIWNHSAAAVAAMASLPLSDVSLERTGTFIARSGDYAWYLARCAAGQRAPEKTDREALAQLSRTAAELSQSVLTLESDLYARNVSFTADREGELPAAVQQFSAVEEGFPVWEGADYDGAMSPHLSDRTPQYTAEASELEAEQARQAAALALNRDAAALQPVGERGGAIPAYGFTAPDGTLVSVSRCGGYLLEICAPEPEGEVSLSPEEASDTAARWLDEHGYRDLQPVWMGRDGEAAAFRFAAETDGVRIYPDAVSVRVSLRDGAILRFNAAEYVMEHHDRGPSAVRVSPERAAESLPEALDVIYTGQALIHSPGKREILCHEFRCRGEDGEELLIWCDGETGQQQAIQMLEKEDDGAAPTGGGAVFSRLSI